MIYNEIRKHRTTKETSDFILKEVEICTKVYDEEFFKYSVEPRYTEKPLDRKLYKKIRRQTPNDEIRDMVNQDLDSMLGGDDFAIPGLTIEERLEADHIVSLQKISLMDGFSELSEADQVEIANYVDNFKGLSKTANTSKGAKDSFEWTLYKKENIEVAHDYRDSMMIRQSLLERNIQGQIDRKRGLL